MPTLAPDYADQLQRAVGPKLADAVRTRADHYHPGGRLVAVEEGALFGVDSRVPSSSAVNSAVAREMEIRLSSNSIS